jgi:hypothetical protein
MIVDRAHFIVYGVMWDCSPIRNLLAFGLLFLFDVTVEFGPRRSGKMDLNQIECEGFD